MTTQFVRFMEVARAIPKEKFTSLYGMVFDLLGLQESFESLAGNKAPGIDGMRKDDYAKNLEERLKDLSQRVRRLGYRPKPSRRVYIPKLNGGSRPLGIPSFEDRIVQDRLARILTEIWEPEFRECSYGFRRGRNAHQALKRIDEIICKEKTQYVVEADIKSFFTTVSHDRMKQFIEHRIADPNLNRLISRFLKAGVIEDGAFSSSTEGTPQGGLVSPVLSNIYLHYVLDLWFEKRFSKQCRSKAFLVRYADDFVACFSKQNDAERFLEELTRRLADFHLEIEPTKTKLINFGSKATQRATFNFLGFTHFMAKTRKGYRTMKRKTEKKRMRSKLKELKGKLKKLSTAGGNAMVNFTRAHLAGHFQYYGVSDNSRALAQYFRCAERILFKRLNRRSQKRSFTWERYNRAVKPLLPRPRIYHQFYTVGIQRTLAGSRMV